MAKRFVMRIELTQVARQHLARLSDHFGMTQVSMMSRVVEWFANQDEMIQSACLSRYPGYIEGDIAKLILKRLISNSNNSNNSSSGDKTNVPKETP